MKKLVSLFCLLSCVLFITSCASTQNNSGANATDNISVGKVQREIVDNILEPELEKRKSDRNYAVRAMIIPNLKIQNEK